MQPVPSSVIKSYPQRGPLQQFRFSEGTAFRCFRCGDTKKSKLIAVYSGDWARRLCNGCYGRLLSLYEIKAGTTTDDQRADALAAALLSLVEASAQREAERLFRAADDRAHRLSAEALRFTSTAERIAATLRADPQLEWSPAVIGLCKAVEVEVVARILTPLAQTTAHADLTLDRDDRDIGRIATYCAGVGRKPPELGTVVHFLQTVVHSEQRRKTSVLIGAFLRLASGWSGSHWLLDPSGFPHTLARLTTSFRNRAAHIDELSSTDYAGCRELVIGSDGVLWKLLIATENPR